MTFKEILIVIVFFQTKSEINKDVFNELLIEFVSQKYLPFNFFEDDVTKKLFSHLNPEVILPSSSTLKRKIFEKYEKMHTCVSNFIKTSGSKISLTIDGWSSYGMKGYYGITVHFVDKNWNLQSILLDFVPAQGKHSGESVANLLYDVLRSYGLLNLIQGVTTDNAASNFTMMSSLGKLLLNFDYKNKHFVCFAHIMNLAAQDFMKIIEPIQALVADTVDSDNSETEFENETGDNESNSSPVSKIRYIVKKIKNSEQMLLKLKSLCEVVNCKMTSPKLDVRTRWNSTLEMLNWSLSVKNALNIFCDNVNFSNQLKLSDNEWVLVSKICSYLRSFKTLSLVLEGEKYCTLPTVVIGVNLLLDKLETWAHELDNKIDRDTNDEQIILCIQAARDKIVKHYNKTNWMYCVALILDPRHKVETFSSSSWGKLLQPEAVKHFEEIFKAEYYNELSNDMQDPVLSVVEETTNVDEFELDINCLFKKAITSKTWRHEIDRYLSEPRADNNDDILDWWKRHENVYPSLAKMARDFLGTPATSVPSERIFSKAALTITKSRNRLAFDSVRSLMCLNSWLSNTSLSFLSSIYQP